ncbi:Rha family transcriptional regulator [Caballeronia sp. LZ032]|uniref:Rha family transcriptional regulator n=1 Tax=Caballeronia sp. LZ032 TaxID=3038565 RepID=UPI002854D060|nr:Rha family transcriptional regulator [Caballeronia sp. LZ032]MDR5878802.1 Rha family transcriptional regulator [Caballeronia sp. LZ032]
MTAVVNIVAALEADRGLLRVRDGVPVVDSLVIAREFGRRHDNVLQTLDSLVADGTINHLDSKAVEYRDAKGEKRRAIELDERGALIVMPFVGGRKSRLGQKRLVDAFLEMRDRLRATAEAQKQAALAPMLKSPVGDLALAESIGRLLNVSPSGRVELLRHVAKNHGLDESLLPAYVVDAPADAPPGSSEATAPITQLLKEHDVQMGPVAFNRLLEHAGLLAKRIRCTTQARFEGGEKSFWMITGAGLRFGKNLVDVRSPRETAPHWFVSRFPDLLSSLRPVYRKLRQEGSL